jgi:glycerate-2-kinase
VLALVLSDVVGDKLEVIASGPTVPDPSTYEEALDILKRYNLTDSAPRTVLEVLEKGARGELPETPKPGDETLSKAHALLLGSNLTALKAMDAYAKKLGLNSVVLTSMLQGEAREAAKALAAIALEVKRSSIPVAPPAAVICGGETTVKVRGRGRGGRNQEFALSAALQIEGEGGIAIAAVGSDGIDGPTDAAGAIVDGFTVKKAKRLGLDPRKFLEENNSYEFFNTVGGHIKTGPTGTNVNDFYLAVVIAQEWE